MKPDGGSARKGEAPLETLPNGWKWRCATGGPCPTRGSSVAPQACPAQGRGSALRRRRPLPN
eukprot:1397513-Alexandrium_andersonii.AAC.1